MTLLGTLTYLRPCAASDDTFLYDVFATTWESEVAALPNQNLAQHVLRIQHIAQERRFASRYPGYERFVVEIHDEPAGRVYVHQHESTMHVVDLTLMPEHRNQGLGSRILRDLFDLAARSDMTVTIRVGRRNRQATDLATKLGFRLVNVDDLDNYFEWSATEPPSDMKEGHVDLVGMKEGHVDLVGMKEGHVDLVGMKESEQASIHHGAGC
jgi:GNAT superfamily N-acetyltransferase